MSRPAIPADAFDHGDPRRYRRGCRCAACTKGVTADAQRRSYLRATGRGAFRTPARAAAHLGKLRAAGLTDAQICKAARLVPSTFYRILHRQGSIHVDTEVRILKVSVPEHPGDHQNGCRIPAAGTVRRLRALGALGWPATQIALKTGKAKQYIVELQNNVPEDGQVRLWVAEYVKVVYSELGNRPPEPHEVGAQTAASTRKRAAGKGWAPVSAWDGDTIDDPTAHPEWTGHCGTDRGYHLHKAEHIPMCPPCEAAHEQWLAAHQHLKGVELRSVIIRARGQAAGRGAALAENARELLAQELSWEAISLRLGADPGQIAAAMRRYPVAQDQQFEAAA